MCLLCADTFAHERLCQTRAVPTVPFLAAYDTHAPLWRSHKVEKALIVLIMQDFQKLTFLLSRARCDFHLILKSTQNQNQASQTQSETGDRKLRLVARASKSRAKRVVQLARAQLADLADKIEKWVKSLIIRVLGGIPRVPVVC